MIGILAEKPSAARNFATALGGMSGKYNNAAYVITAARGHLYEAVNPVDMCPADKIEKYKSWSLSLLPWDERDFSWKRVPKKDTSALLRDIKSTLSTCDEIVIATDVDPTGEGELLAYEILIELGLTKKKITRMYHVDESVKEVQKAFTNRKVIQNFYGNPDYVKALYRSQFDYLTMQFTRIATTCVNSNVPIRNGRLKSYMVRLVGEQLEKIANYKKVPFYMNKFRDENGNVYTNPNEPVFPDKTMVPQKYDTSGITVTDTERKSTAPKRLIDLAGLAAMLAPKGYKAKDVLAVYQKMYEAQVVSYPRTEDKTISPEQFNDLLPHIDKISQLVGVDASLLTHRTPRSTHVKTGAAHGANRPGPNIPNDITSLTQYGACAPAIYEIVAKSYLAMLAEDYLYDSEKGYVTKYPAFKGSASIPVSQGWKAVFNDNDDETDDNTGKHLGKNAVPFIHEGFPPKPTAPTMKWLMQQLEKHDVGTGATRTSIYADVTNEKSKAPLLVEKKGKLSMAECGEISYKLLPNTHIGSVTLTEEMQQDMRDIAAGKTDPDKCLAKIANYVTDDIKTMTANSQTIKKAGNSMAGSTVEKEKYEGMFDGKTVRFNRVYCEHRFTDEECQQLCDGKQIEILDCVSHKDGKTSIYGVYGKLSEQTYNGHKFFGFERLGFASNNNGVPRGWCGHVFTDAEKKSLEDGSEIFIEGLKNKVGKIFSANLRYDSKEKKIIPRY